MNTVIEKTHAHVSAGDPDTPPTVTERKSKRMMMVAGSLGVLAAVLVVASPELGVGGVIGGAIAGSGSAIATLLARR